MSDQSYPSISIGATLIGIIAGAALALLFAVTGNPGLMGVGAAIGVSVTLSLSQRRERQ